MTGKNNFIKNIGFHIDEINGCSYKIDEIKIEPKEVVTYLIKNKIKELS